jgi:hypothetical protein
VAVWNELIAYYEQNYETIDVWSFTPQEKIRLGNKHDRQCRFCDRREPDVTFKKKAHAIPEAIGNKSLLTYYECDECNEAFGSGIETDFGNWSKPMRTMSRIKGKTGVPTIRERRDGGWRIEYHPTGLKANQDEIDKVMEVNQDTKTLTFRLRRDPYTPVSVLKALIKMGLSVFPDSEMPHFRPALDWIRPGNTKVTLVNPTSVLHTFIGGSTRSDLITISTLRRKNDSLLIPYAFFLLTYGSEMFQTFVPSAAKDRHVYGNMINLPRFPNIRDLDNGENGNSTTSLLDLSGTSVVTNDVITLDLAYENRVVASKPTG